MKIFLPFIVATAVLLSCTNAASDPKACTHPPLPANGAYTVIDLNSDLSKANEYLALNYTCNDGYQTYDSKVRLCFNGTWTDEPKCVRICKLIEKPNIEYSCLGQDKDEGSPSTRPCKELEPEGTLIQTKCRPPHYYPLGVMPLMQCINGSWDVHPTCISVAQCHSGVRLCCLLNQSVHVVNTEIILSLFTDETCLDPNGIEGLCVGIQDCVLANDIIKRKVNSTICGFNGTDPIICCPRKYTRFQTKKTCEPYTARRPDMKFGKIAFHKCIEYQEQIKFPCVAYSYFNRAESSGLSVRYTRSDACSEPPSLVVGSEGIDASRGQFPHMALLGYGEELSTAEWLCGGTIISEQFILTAGHCTEHKTYGQVAFARLGILKRSDPSKVVRDYGIKRAIKHPGYKPPSKYNDIALLETQKRIVFLNKHIEPACLDAGDDAAESEAEEASATGWGALGEGGGNADVLQIMEITRFTSEECYAEYKPHRLLKNGIDNTTQMCYGHRMIPRDTCSGDSGGPLQVAARAPACMHKVVGVTSFGRACGRAPRPGVYTRVRPYVPWVEALVWPEGDYVFAT